MSQRSSKIADLASAQSRKLVLVRVRAEVQTDSCSRDTFERSQRAQLYSNQTSTRLYNRLAVRGISSGVVSGLGHATEATRMRC